MQRGRIGSFGLDIKGLQDQPEKRIAAFKVWRNQELDIIPLVLAQLFVQTPDKGCFSAANRAVHVDGADPVPCHKLAFRECFFDLGREEQKPGIRVADKGVFTKSEIFNYCLYIHNCANYESVWQ